ncbi:MAG: hypothetical protein K9G39_00175 [Chlorobium sp.]|nr:hypothetical protein [Chlorobium sp.]
MPEREVWSAMLEERLPVEAQAVARNLAITSGYATWYLEKPELFKWAGMAAFASRQVGLALIMFELMQAPSMDVQQKGGANAGIGELIGALLRTPIFFASSLHTFAADRLLFSDFDVIRRGNNSIYRDIAWAHAAYLHGGIDEVEAGCFSADESFMLQGFRLIDEGRRELAANHGSMVARSLIREGNILLLRHEQQHTLQPLFETVSPAGSIVVSFGSELDFSCGTEEGRFRKASFAGFAGFLETAAGLRSITVEKDRWAWIEREVLPAWEAAEGSFCRGSAIERQLLGMAAQEGDPLRSLTMAAGALSRNLGGG